ncbi:MAG: hypothetical protein O3B37_10755 [Proteobacteria bacterium]|nr:hypothetical protein [Pseudomonadota bacterium]
MTTRANSGNLANKPAFVCLLALAVALGGGAAWAQSSASSGPAGPATRDAGTLSHDCTEVTVDYADEPGLTREERIARMDRAFQRSLSRFEECQSQRAGTGGGTGAGGTGAGGGTGGGDGELRGTEAAGKDAAGSESDGGETSTAASDISGPDAPLEAPSQEGSPTAASDVTGDAPTVTTASTTSSDPNGKWTRPDDPARDTAIEDRPSGDEPVREAARTQGGGKVPEDIPPADNDSALEAQIRQAAIEETDPELKKRLWDEYRRYKGLPAAK